MNKKSCVVLLGTLLLPAVIACDPEQPHGIVVEKEYEPERQKLQTRPVTTCTTSRDPRTSRTVTTCQRGSETYWKTSPECWELDVMTDAGQEEEYCVTEEEWNAVEVGDRL